MQQQARLFRRAAANLHQGRRTRGCGYLGGMCAQDGPLGASWVVLGQTSDLIEQLASYRVVEVLGRQSLGPPAEPGADVGGQRGSLPDRIEMRDGHEEPSAASIVGSTAASVSQRRRGPPRNRVTDFVGCRC